MRGLKHLLSKTIASLSCRIFYRCVDWNFQTCQICVVYRSHLLQMRGLKHKKSTSFALDRCRIFYRCVDWNRLWLIGQNRTLSRIFYRCVDWNLLVRLPLQWMKVVASFTDAWIETNYQKGNVFVRSRIFYRCVDWNIVMLPYLSSNRSRIFYRCVDWNR